jgi:DNA-binding MarR family transcriptional regulator
MDDAQRRLGLLGVLPRLARLSAVLNRGRLVERAMAAAGVTVDRPGMTTLLTLHTAGEPLRVGEIAHRQQVVGPHITRQIHELERRELVRRVADPTDQRARLVELTPAGSRAAEGYLGAVLGWFDDVLAGWSEPDRADLGRLLARFADDLTTHLDALGED